jgi:hypothetical protein
MHATIITGVREVRMTTSERSEHEQKGIELAYTQVCASYAGITEFRGKLLTLLPLATGAGGLLILREWRPPSSSSAYLAPVGLFGVVVTVGLYLYEFRGVQRCHRLEYQAAKLEELLYLNSDSGQFIGQPKRLGKHEMIGPPAAGLVVYLAVVFAWVYIAGVGLQLWSGEGRWVAGVVLLPAYAVIFAVLYYGVLPCLLDRTAEIVTDN